MEKEIEVDRVEPCAECKGSGSKPGTAPIDCSDCNGLGQVRRIQRSIFGQFSQSGPCNTCNGQGKIITDPCTYCKGSSRERKRRRIKVDIPAGIEDSMQIRLTRQGNAGENGGPPGNLYVELNIKEHEIFTRRANDVLLNVPINFAQAALGDELELPSLTGTTTLKIPSGTQSGTEFRIKGIGIPHMSRSRKGDQLVIVHVVTPKKLSSDQKKLFDELSKTM